MNFWRKLSARWHRRRFENEMAEEMRLHLELQREKNVAAGMRAEEAGYAAQRQFGGLEQIKERCREQRGWLWVEQLGQDLRFAGRGLRRQPGFAAVVIAVLAAGIGANATVFTVFDALLLRPMPIVSPDRLHVVEARGPVAPGKEFPYPLFDPQGRHLPIPYPYFEALRDHGSQSAEIATASGWSMLRPCVLPGGEGATESVFVEEVSGNYFSVVGVGTAMGRSLLPEDDRPGSPAPVAVVSYDFWQRHLGADPDVLGKVVRIDNVPLTIVGVAARRFNGARVGGGAAFWVPIQLSRQIDGNLPWGADALHSLGSPWINILARLRTGATNAQATAELDAAYQQMLARIDPRRAAGLTEAQRERLQELHLALVPAGTGYGGVRSYYERPATLLMALVGFIQLVACANVAGLLLARGSARLREFALRTTLGASRGRLLRQLFTESFVLAGLAGVVGLLLAQFGTRLLANAVVGVEIWADNRVLLFTVSVTLLSGLMFGLLPAWRLSGRELNAAIKEASGAKRHRMNAALVVAQVALAFGLLVVAGLLGRTLHNLTHAATGFTPQGRQLFDANPPAGYRPAQRFALFERMKERVASVPNVSSVATYQGFPLLGDTAYVLRFTVDGQTPIAGEAQEARIGRVGPGFFSTMGIPLLSGRDFDGRDTDNIARGLRPIVIGAAGAKRLFGEQSPLGHHIKLDADFEIVGVVGDVKYGGLREDPGFVFYVPLQHWPNEFRVTFVVNAAAGATPSASDLRGAIRSIDPEAQISGLRTIESRLDGHISQDRLVARLAGFFGLLALVFAGLGLFGLMSYTVSARTREFGVRMALGSTPEAILTSVVRRGLLLGAIGCGGGAIVAFGLTRLVTGLLYGVGSADPLTFIGVGAMLVWVMVLAAALPARRAARVDPMVALRCE